MKTKINHTSWKSVTLAVTASLLMSGVASAQTTPTPAPTVTPAPVTVTLPTASLDNSVLIDTVIIQPVVTTNIAPSFNYVSFQGDFTFDETVVTFDPGQPVQAAGLTGGTGANTWTVAGDIRAGTGPIRTLRVLAFVHNTVTALNGSGTLFELRMLRVSSTPCTMSTLVWRPYPDDFEFVDSNGRTPSPTQLNGLITIAAPATWLVQPFSDDWNTASNWVGMTLPNDPSDTATFAVSDTTSVSITANTVVDGIVFDSCASAFTISTSPAVSLTISGAGIMNNSGFDQTFQNTTNSTDRGQTIFQGSASAGSAGSPDNLFISDGGVASGPPGGRTLFDQTSNADNATLIANGGSGGALGGAIEIVATATGGTAQVEVFDNGFLDISSHNFGTVTIGSLEGSGNAFLGGNNLTVGSRNTNTIFSGVIQDGGVGGGIGGSLTKTGTGKLTLSGANTYTGPTIINGGCLRVDGSIVSPVVIVTSSGTLIGTLGGSGTIFGTVFNVSGVLYPGDPQTLTVNGNYQENSGATLRLAIAGTGAGSFDRLVVLGAITLMNGSVLELDFINGFAPHAGDTFDLVAYGSLTGNFSTIDIEGLEPGFQYTLAPDGSGNLQLTALNDGVPISTAINISGTITYCSGNPVPGVTLTLTGTMGGSTFSNGSGNYTLSALPSGGNYVVTPTKAARTPGSAGINGIDVLATQKHYLGIALLPVGCRRTAADVNGGGVINGVDVLAIQKFFLGFTSGIANVGKYQFTPASRSYTSVTSNQTAQNYDALIFGDVASGFVHRPDGPSQDALGDDGLSFSTLSGLNTSADEVPATVAKLALPNVAVDISVTNFIAQVATSTINAGDNLVGFQGDFTFDERMVTFQDPPVQNAGLTAGNWNVSGNVLSGPGPMRTLRILAYSNDFTPLSGSGTLFELRMTRVSKAAQSTQLLWAAPPDQFIFIDADLKTQKPGDAVAGIVKTLKR